MLRRLGVCFTTDHDLARIDDHALTVLDVYTKAALRVDGVDALVLVNGAAAQDGLFHALKAAQPALEVHLVGDAVAPRRINDAIYEAELVARRI
jgi:hypothetical protein